MKWRDIPGFPNYQASDSGLIRSLDWMVKRGRGNGRMVHKPGRVLAMHARTRDGKMICQTVIMRLAGKTYCKRVHRLVLLAFKGAAPEGMEGCHNDGNPLNNNLSNLRWDTKSANARDSIKHGTFHFTDWKKGAKHHNAKLTEKDVKEIIAADQYRGVCSALSKVYGVSAQTIFRIRNGKAWTHV